MNPGAALPFRKVRPFAFSEMPPLNDSLWRRYSGFAIGRSRSNKLDAARQPRLVHTPVPRTKIGCLRRDDTGTFDGSTALNLAANTPADAQIVTVDLPPNWEGDFSLQTPEEYQNITDRGTVGQRFRNTEHEGKIEQVFGDSAMIDWPELPGRFDIVFIGGCHYYDYVAKDTQNPLKYLRPEGLIIWHDYG
jgi:hypothetical protein